MTTRELLASDLDAVEIFLAGHAETSMFLRNNLRSSARQPAGKLPEGVWVGAFEGDGLVGVVNHNVRTSVLLQAPRGLPECLAQLRALSDAPVGGLIGPWSQVEEARAVLGFERTETTLDSEEVLYHLDLSALRMPVSMRSGEVTWRVARSTDTGLLVPWRAAYSRETGAALPGVDPDKSAPGEINYMLDFYPPRAFVAEAGGKVVAFSAFNASLPDCVQVGGVYTPPELRGKGYAQAVVAGSLTFARDAGVLSAVLFTQPENVPARRAYETLGFREIGRYGLVLFSKRQPPPQRVTA